MSEIHLIFAADFEIKTQLKTLKNQNQMKVKLSKKQIEAILADPEKAQEAGVKSNDPWWVIVLKIVAYAIGLILAGAVTTSCSSMLGII